MKVVGTSALQSSPTSRGHSTLSSLHHVDAHTAMWASIESFANGRQPHIMLWEGGSISGSGPGSVSSGSASLRRLSGERSGSLSGSGISSGSGRAGRPGVGGSAGRVLPGGACSGGSNSGTVPGIEPAVRPLVSRDEMSFLHEY